MNNIVAHTPATHPYPPYLSINDTGDMVSITVRAPAAVDGTCGTSATMTIEWLEFCELLANMNGYAARRPR